MRRAITGATAAIALTLAVPGGALASTTLRHVSFTFLGASVSPTENVYDVRGPGFRGAAIQIVKVNKAGTAGTDRVRTYTRQGIIVSADSFTLSTPATTGLITIKGSGHFVGGTGRYAHISGHYTFSGTDDPTTNLIKVTATGTESY